VAQKGVPPAQALLHWPQWPLLERLTSQPVLGLASQSAYPSMQRNPQRPAVQVPAALDPAAQALSQAPQCRLLVRVSTSQPLLALPSQSANPATQVNPQAPAVHRAVALAGTGQVVPQRPQWATSVRVSTSQPLVAELSQSPKPVAQVDWQRPLLHVAVALAPG